LQRAKLEKSEHIKSDSREVGRERREEEERAKNKSPTILEVTLINDIHDTFERSQVNKFK
jgi:hypothetical protein